MLCCLSALPPAFREEGPNGSQGGGAVLLVIKGTAHHTFTDVVPYFHARFSWLTRLVRVLLMLHLHCAHSLSTVSTVWSARFILYSVLVMILFVHGVESNSLTVVLHVHVL